MHAGVDGAGQGDRDPATSAVPGGPIDTEVGTGGTRRHLTGDPRVVVRFRRGDIGIVRPHRDRRSPSSDQHPGDGLRRDGRERAARLQGAGCRLLEDVEPAL